MSRVRLTRYMAHPEGFAREFRSPCASPAKLARKPVEQLHRGECDPS
jgi:hypothetical protein